MDHYTFNSLFICSSVSHHQGSCLPIQWVRWVRIQEKLWEKHFKHICQICGNYFKTSYHYWKRSRQKSHRNFKNLIIAQIRLPNMGLHVWLITSKQTDPELKNDNAVKFQTSAKTKQEGWDYLQMITETKQLKLTSHQHLDGTSY